MFHLIPQIPVYAIFAKMCVRPVKQLTTYEILCSDVGKR